MSNLVVLALILAIGVVALTALMSSLGGGGKPRYRPVGELMTKAELKCYRRLVAAVDGQFLIFSKVRIADIILPRKGFSKKSWWSAFTKVSSKHADFVICDPRTTEIICAVELDDRSHEKRKRRKRDEFLHEAFQSAGMPLLRIKISHQYEVSELRQALSEATGRQLAA